MKILLKVLVVGMIGAILVCLTPVQSQNTSITPITTVGGGGGSAPTGTAGGALTGTYPNPQVASGTSITNANLGGPNIHGTSSPASVGDGTARPVIWGTYATASTNAPIGAGTDFHYIDLNLSANTSTNLNGLANLYPFESQAVFYGTGNFGKLEGGLFEGVNSSSGLLSGTYALRLANQNLSTGTITNAYDAYMQDSVNSGGGTIQNNYGLYIEPHISGVNNYDIYAPGTNSQFGGLRMLGQLIASGTNNQFGASTFTINTSPGVPGVQINQSHTTSLYALSVTSSGAHCLFASTALNSGRLVTLSKTATGDGKVIQASNKGTGLTLDLGDGTNTTFQVFPDGTTTSTNGFGSYGVKTITTSATGATNTLTVNVVLYVTAATGASLTDNAGTTEFSGVAITAFTPVRLQPGGKFVGTSITYATGTASHAW